MEMTEVLVLHGEGCGRVFCVQGIMLESCYFFFGFGFAMFKMFYDLKALYVYIVSGILYFQRCY